MRSPVTEMFISDCALERHIFQSEYNLEKKRLVPFSGRTLLVLEKLVKRAMQLTIDMSIHPANGLRAII